MTVTGTTHLSFRGDSDGATAMQPAGWSPLHGMLTDRFGVTWVVDVAVRYG